MASTRRPRAAGHATVTGTTALPRQRVVGGFAPGGRALVSYAGGRKERPREKARWEKGPAWATLKERRDTRQGATKAAVVAVVAAVQ